MLCGRLSRIYASYAQSNIISEPLLRAKSTHAESPALSYAAPVGFAGEQIEIRQPLSGKSFGGGGRNPFSRVAGSETSLLPRSRQLSPKTGYEGESCMAHEKSKSS